jgi:outer membrane biosynthesis protein TonB
MPIASNARQEAVETAQAPTPSASPSPSRSQPAKKTPKPKKTKKVKKPKASPSPRPRATRTAAPRASRSATATTRPSYVSPKAYAKSVLSAAQFLCADAVFTRESNWNPYATNPSSGAYGIAQALPAEKYASAGSDWRTNGVTQVRWGLSYMGARYGNPCGAWAFWQSHHWY